MADLDRKKHDMDVMERVLGGVREAIEAQGGHTEVVDLDVRAWIAGTTTSAVQMTIGGLVTESRERGGAPEPRSRVHDRAVRGRRERE